MTTIDAKGNTSMKALWVVLGVVGLLVLVVILSFGSYVSAKNQMVQLNEDVDQNYSQVDIQQQRRLDLIPNLVASVKGYTAKKKPSSPTSPMPVPASSRPVQSRQQHSSQHQARRRPDPPLSPSGGVPQSQGQRSVHASRR